MTASFWCLIGNSDLCHNCFYFSKGFMGLYAHPALPLVAKFSGGCIWQKWSMFCISVKVVEWFSSGIFLHTLCMQQYQKKISPGIILLFWLHCCAYAHHTRISTSFLTNLQKNSLKKKFLKQKQKSHPLGGNFFVIFIKSSAIFLEPLLIARASLE